MLCVAAEKSVAVFIICLERFWCKVDKIKLRREFNPLLSASSIVFVHQHKSWQSYTPDAASFPCLTLSLSLLSHAMNESRFQYNASQRLRIDKIKR